MRKKELYFFTSKVSKNVAFFFVVLGENAKKFRPPVKGAPCNF